jgi:signal peptidase I
LASRKKSAVREWVFAIGVALVIILAVRLFLMEVFTIPTTSMEKSLRPGDFIVVNKANYGARIPLVPLSVPFCHQYLPFTQHINAYLDWIRLPYFRLPGYGEISRNDVIVFNYPVDEDHPVSHKTYFVKRCIALPGDTLLIDNTKVLVNQRVQDDHQNLLFNYNISLTADIDAEDVLKDLEISEGGKISSNQFRIPLSDADAKSLSISEKVQSISKWIEQKSKFYDYIFPYVNYLPYNTDNFGPVIIPRKNLEVRITPINLPFYERVIRNYEGNELELIDNVIYINGQVAENYTFKMNYYFMMGDNRHYSSDSRFWGFLPEDHIVGKAEMILFSAKPSGSFGEKIRWDRFFKGL